MKCTGTIKNRFRGDGWWSNAVHFAPISVARTELFHACWILSRRGLMQWCSGMWLAPASIVLISDEPHLSASIRQYWSGISDQFDNLRSDGNNIQNVCEFWNSFANQALKSHCSHKHTIDHLARNLQRTDVANGIDQWNDFQLFRQKTVSELRRMIRVCFDLRKSCSLTKNFEDFLQRWLRKLPYFDWLQVECASIDRHLVSLLFSILLVVPHFCTMFTKITGRKNCPPPSTSHVWDVVRKFRPWGVFVPNFELAESEKKKKKLLPRTSAWISIFVQKIRVRLFTSLQLRMWKLLHEHFFEK